ncbi:MAG: RHS repeat-associated core domain-containing protein, partial [Aureliella sp.]
VTTVTNHRTFNANGKLVAETNAAVDLLFAFTGKQLDDSTGLQHNLFRWYDGNLGQWLSEDPMGFSAGDGNLKRYVGNHQTLSTDPTGLVVNPQDPPDQNAGSSGELFIDDVLRLLRRPLEEKIKDTISDSVRDIFKPRGPLVVGPYFPSDLPTVPADFAFPEREYYDGAPLFSPLIPDPGPKIPVPVKVERPYGPFKPGTKFAPTKLMFSTEDTRLTIDLVLPSDIDYQNAVEGNFRSIYNQIQDKTKGRLIDGITITFEIVK